MPQSINLFLNDEEATDSFGKEIGKAIEKLDQKVIDSGLNIRLNGDLGAGKTSLVRAIIRALGYKGRVKSPTFTLLEPYSFKNFDLNHFDFYRFEDPEEFEEAGFRDDFGPRKICFTEWTSKAQPHVPEADLIVNLTTEGNGRNISIESQSLKGEQLLELLEKVNQE